MPKLTKTIVERAEPRQKTYLIFDDHLPGFCLRVTPNGKRHYYLQYMKNKKVKRLMLGLHGILTAETDDRLTWPERELVKQLGEKLYGKLMNDGEQR